MHGLEAGHFLAFAYNGEAVLTVKVFDGTLCRHHYNVNNGDRLNDAE